MLKHPQYKLFAKTFLLNQLHHLVPLINMILICIIISTFVTIRVSFGFALLPVQQIRVDPNAIQPRNPHWQAEGCSVCHQGKQETISPIAQIEVDTICISCHNNRYAHSEVHPVGRNMVPSDRFTRPSDWPLINDKLGCLTCHDVKKACDSSLKRPLANPIFLRERLTGNKQKFCQNCHLPASFDKFIPHIMISGSNETINLSEKKDIDESVCLFCHTELLDRNTLKRTGEPHLRSPQEVLCQICHRMYRTISNHEHNGIPIPPEMQVYMYARELLGPTVKIDNQYLARLAESDVKSSRMASDSEGKITCSTCHNPHQENVFPRESVLANETMWLIGPSRIKSPSTGKSICINCHS